MNIGTYSYHNRKYVVIDRSGVISLWKERAHTQFSHVKRQKYFMKFNVLSRPFYTVYISFYFNSSTNDNL